MYLMTARVVIFLFISAYSTYEMQIKFTHLKVYRWLTTGGKFWSFHCFSITQLFF